MPSSPRNHEYALSLLFKHSKNLLALICLSLVLASLQHNDDFRYWYSSPFCKYSRRLYNLLI